jgi:hypothetical protein
MKLLVYGLKAKPLQALANKFGSPQQPLDTYSQICPTQLLPPLRPTQLLIKERGIVFMYFFFHPEYALISFLGLALLHPTVSMDIPHLVDAGHFRHPTQLT